MSKILLVDDDPSFRKATARSLVKSGYEVVECENGEDALRALNQSKPDLVVTDIVMPDMEGIELIMALRKKAPDIKVIAISGGGRNEPTQYLTTAKMMGASASIAKPFEPDVLVSEIVRLLTE